MENKGEVETIIAAGDKNTRIELRLSHEVDS